MSERVSMPALGESVTEGTVTRWLKNVGDTVADLDGAAPNIRGGEPAFAGADEVNGAFRGSHGANLLRPR